MPHKLKYRVLPERLAVCRAMSEGAFLGFALGGKLSCLVRTPEEFSCVCEESLIAQEREGLRIEEGWVALKLEGPFAFEMTGVLASFIEPLAAAGIPIFAISTFDTDYVLVKREGLEQAIAALGAVGHERLD